MNSKVFLFTVLIIVGLCSCDTEPQIDMDKLDNYYFVECTLTNDTVQSLTIQHMRYLVDFAFSDRPNSAFGVSGATVKLKVADTEYTFADSGTGLYKCRTDSIPEGMACSLLIVLSDGTEFQSSIITPSISLLPKDTLWIIPDSAFSFISEGDEEPNPAGVIGSHFTDTIYYEISPGSILMNPEPHIWYERINNHLWMKIDTLQNAILVTTATDSPSVLYAILDTTQLSRLFYYSISHINKFYEKEYVDIDDGHLDEEMLKKYSNIEGEKIYGFFTSDGVSIEKYYQIKIRK